MSVNAWVRKTFLVVYSKLQAGILTGIFADDLETLESKTTIELNFALLQFKDGKYIGYEIVWL